MRTIRHHTLLASLALAASLAACNGAGEPVYLDDAADGSGAPRDDSANPADPGTTPDPEPIPTEPGGTPGTPEPGAGNTPDPGTTPEPDARPEVLLVAGDVAGDPSLSRDEDTAALLDELVKQDPHAVIQTSGDNAQGSGTASEYNEWFQANWGRHKARIRAAAGNHDYKSGGGAYYAYFGEAAGPAGKGWYAYDLGAHWRVVVLNSNVANGTGSDQYRWFQQELQANAGRNVVAVWHHPRYTSGAKYGPGMSEFDHLFDLAANHGVDLVLSSHDHHWERFAPMNAAGQVDRAHGTRQFVVGTGGYKVTYTAGNTAPNTEKRITHTEGITRLALHPDRYEWEFVPIAGKTATDKGSAPVSSAP